MFTHDSENACCLLFQLSFSKSQAVMRTVDVLMSRKGFNIT